MRHLTGEHLVEHDAHGVDVGAMIHRAAEHECLGSHVMERAHRHAALGQPQGLSTFAMDLCKAKVGHLHVSIVADHDVGRFDVTVDDAALVRVSQGIANMRRDRHRVIGVQAA